MDRGCHRVSMMMAEELCPFFVDKDYYDKNPISKSKNYCGVAQSVESGPVKTVVGGSNPSAAANSKEQHVRKPT